jgi:ankyrin repeat protein
MLWNVFTLQMETRKPNGQGILHIAAEFGCAENLSTICSALGDQNLLKKYLDDQGQASWAVADINGTFVIFLHSCRVE